MGKDKALATAAPQEKEDGADGPTIAFVSKRLRNVRKKLSNIDRIETQQKECKPINSEQEAALQNKVLLKALEDELSKIVEGLRPIVEEEREIAAAKTAEPLKAQPEPSAPATPPVPAGPTPEDIEAMVQARADAAVQEKLRRFLDLVYYAKLFDSAPVDPFTIGLEKNACLSWDAYKDEAQADLLREQDLDAIAGFGRLLTARQAEEARSHNDAVDDRVGRVLSFLDPSSSVVVPELGGITCARLRNRLDRIVGGEYVQQTPELLPTSQAGAAPAAAANAAGASPAASSWGAGGAAQQGAAAGGQGEAW